jgi:hypothetical protein
MTKHSKNKIRENQSKQSKDENESLSDYVKRRLEEEGIPVQKKKLPKDWTRVIFKP